jgi:hypothetical protein
MSAFRATSRAVASVSQVGARFSKAKNFANESGRRVVSASEVVIGLVLVPLPPSSTIDRAIGQALHDENELR